MARRQGNPAGIPVFPLYGEAAPFGLERLHIEDIRSRSERYGWQIGAHRHHGLLQVLVLLRGAGVVVVESETREVAGPVAVVLPPGTAHAFRFQPGVDGYVLTLAEALTDATLAPGIVALAPEAARRMETLLAEIVAEFRDTLAGHAEALEGLSRALLVKLRREQAMLRLAEGPAARQSAAFARFRALVEAHYTEHRPIGFYAAALAMSESRLNRLCRATAGKSAQAVVADRLLLEAQRKLVHIAAPVSLLAAELGFEDPAYFWRFFRKRTGLTPRAFRHAALQG